MSLETVLGNIISVMSLLVVIPIIASSAKSVTVGSNKVLSVFFTFSMVSYFLSEVYYFTYNLLIPDTRMPFAANEIAEASMILFLCAVLEVTMGREKKVNVPVFFFSVMFIGSNIVLWILWSGEWIKNVLFGLPYVYFFYLLISGILKSKAASVKEIALLSVIAFVILGMEGAALMPDERIGYILEVSCYPLMYVLWILIFVRTVSVLCGKEKSSNGKEIYLSFSLHIWTMLLMFLSAGIFYNIANLLYVTVLPLMYLSFKKELSEDGIC